MRFREQRNPLPSSASQEKASCRARVATWPLLWGDSPAQPRLPPLPSTASQGEGFLQSTCGHLASSLGGQPRTASTPSQPTQHRPAGPLNGQDGSSKPQMDSLSSCTSSQPSSYPGIFITGKDARGWDGGSRCSVPFWLLRNRILT